MDPEIFDKRFLRNEKATDTAVPRFYTKAEKDESASKESGKAIYRDVEWVEIRVPGDRFNIVQRAATQTDKARFAGAYEQFKKGLEQKVEGFPLEAWNIATPAMTATLNGMNCYTVEQFANMPESGLPKFPGILKIQKQAREFLGAREDTARINQLQHQIETLQSQIAMRDEKIGALEAQLAQSKPLEGGVQRRKVG